MNKKALWVSLFCLVIVLLAACAPATKTPTASPSSPSPTTATPPRTTPTAASPSPSKPTGGVGPVSFAGRTVTMVVPYGTGGSADITARVYARFLPRFLPGSPTVIVRNIPGGNATEGSNFVYQSRPDGLTVLLSAGSVQLAYITRMSAVRYDFQKMEAILGVTAGGLYYTRPGVVASAEALPTTKGIVFGHTTGSLSWLFIIFTKLMDFRPDKMVAAYPGGGDARRAFLSGEVNVTADTVVSFWDVLQPYLKNKEIQVLFQTGIPGANGEIVKDPGLPNDIPTAKDIYEKVNGKPPSGIAWDAYKAIAAAGVSYAKVIMLPPNTPAPIANAWWDAGERMFKDAEFRKSADSLLGAGANLMAGESFSRTFKTSMTMDAKVLEWLKATLQQFNIVVE